MWKITKCIYKKFWLDILTINDKFLFLRLFIFSGTNKGSALFVSWVFNSWNFISIIITISRSRRKNKATTEDILLTFWTHKYYQVWNFKYKNLWLICHDWYSLHKPCTQETCAVFAQLTTLFQECDCKFSISKKTWREIEKSSWLKVMKCICTYLQSLFTICSRPHQEFIMGLLIKLANH